MTMTRPDTTTECHFCHDELDIRDATQRAAGDFVTVLSWHRACYDLTHAQPSIPAQRTGEHDARGAA